MNQPLRRALETCGMLDYPSRQILLWGYSRFPFLVFWQRLFRECLPDISRERGKDDPHFRPQ